MRLPIQSMQAVRICDPATGHWFRSVIVDYEPDQELVILLPNEKDRDFEADTTPVDNAKGGAPPTTSSVRDDLVDPPAFDKGSPIQVEVSLPDGVRRFNSVVRRLELKYGGCLRVTWPTAGTRIQRRDFVRVDVTYRVVIHFVDAEGQPHEMEGSTLDISAGGVRLRMAQPLPADLEIAMEISVPALGTTILKGRVVRSGEIEKKRAGLLTSYWVAVEFLGVDASLRKDLTQLVFDIQRDQLRRRYDEQV